MMDLSTIRAGFVGFGEVNTPLAFITARCETATHELRQRGVTLVDAGTVSDDPAGLQADQAAGILAKAPFDALVVCIAGWIPSWAVLKTIEPFKHKPILLWGLSGWREKDHFVTTADQAGSTALRAPLAAMGYNVKYLVNFKDSPPRYDEAAAYLRAASAAAALRNAKIGMAGYRDMNLYGTLYDGNLLKGKLGTEIEHFDLLELQQIVADTPAAALKALSDKVRATWVFQREPQPGTIENSVKFALACQRKIADRHYDAFSFCDVDGVKKLMKFAPAGAMTLLHELVAIPSVPENDSYGAVTQLILKALTGQNPAYLEFYEFTSTAALMGVPDYVPSAIVDGPITVMPNAFGSFGEGLLNVSKLKTGQVTIARLFAQDGKLAIHAALATAKTPAAWEEAGWAPPAPQLPSLEVTLPTPSDDFLQYVAGQHYIVCYGNAMTLLKFFCDITGIGLIAQQ